jgi:TATA-binding protein-associated factor
LKAIAVAEGEWPWAGVIRLLELELFDPVWSTRHGAACAMRDIVKTQGVYGGMRSGKTALENAINHERWANELSSKIICVLVMDRFCDFSNDQVRPDSLLARGHNSIVASLFHQSERPFPRR